MDDLNRESQSVTPASPQTPSVPPPPKGPEIKIRTMESDIKSVEQSGGSIPEAETIKPEELENGGSVGEITPPEPISEQAVPPIRQISPIAGAEELVVEVKEQPAPKKTRRWLIWLLVISILIAVGAAAYVYLIPLFTYVSVPAPVQPPVTTPQPVTPVQLPTIPAGRPSIFGLEEQRVVNVEVGDYSVVNILTALQNEASLMSADQPFKELKLTVGGLPANFSQFLAALLPELANSQTTIDLTNNFEEQFTGFLIYQEGQAWPGYVVKKKNPQVTVAKLSGIEKSSISNIYLTLPSGQISFNTGPVGEKYTSRYTSFSNKPASFNYGLFGDYLIISTTFQGLTKAIELLGL